MPPHANVTSATGVDKHYGRVREVLPTFVILALLLERNVLLSSVDYVTCGKGRHEGQGGALLFSPLVTDAG